MYSNNILGINIGEENIPEIEEAVFINKISLTMFNKRNIGNL